MQATWDVPLFRRVLGLALALAVALVVLRPGAASAESITEFPVRTAGSGPWGIAAGPDGAIWFTERAADQIGRIAADGTVNELGPLFMNTVTLTGLGKPGTGALVQLSS
jgi:streptogramin lyase